MRDHNHSIFKFTCYIEPQKSAEMKFEDMQWNHELIHCACRRTLSSYKKKQQQHIKHINHNQNKLLVNSILAIIYMGSY